MLNVSHNIHQRNVAITSDTQQRSKSVEHRLHYLIFVYTVKSHINHAISHPLVTALTKYILHNNYVLICAEVKLQTRFRLHSVKKVGKTRITKSLAGDLNQPARIIIVLKQACHSTFNSSFYIIILLNQLFCYSIGCMHSVQFINSQII